MVHPKDHDVLLGLETPFLSKTKLTIYIGLAQNCLNDLVD